MQRKKAAGVYLATLAAASVVWHFVVNRPGMRYRLRFLAASSFRSLLFPSLLAAGLSLLSAHAAERTPKVAPAPPPPVPVTIKARRGEVTDIPLRIFGTRAQPLTFIIRAAPASGKLSAQKKLSDESSMVRYTPPADRAVTRDSFTYAVRSTEGVSAAAEVKIEIVDIPAELIAPFELNNSQILTGETETLTLELTNRGGDVCEGDATVEAPWRIEPPAHYRIEKNGHAILHITFAPEVPGEFRGEIHYSSHQERLTNLSGMAVAALAIRPVALDLKLESLTGVRAGAFEVKNNTKIEQTVVIHCSERLKLDSSLTLPPDRSAAITVQTRADDTEPISEVIRFEAHGISAVLPVRAALVPPLTSPVQPPPPATREVAASALPSASPPETAQSPKRTASVRQVPSEPRAEDVPHRFDPMAVTRKVANTPTSLIIEWPTTVQPESCHAEVRDLSLQGGELISTWHPIDHVQITPTGDFIRATFTQLQPGHAYAIRVVSPTGDDGGNEPVAQIDFITPPLPRLPPIFTFPRVLGLALGVLLTCVIWLRLRAKEARL